LNTELIFGAKIEMNDLTVQSWLNESGLWREEQHSGNYCICSTNKATKLQGHRWLLQRLNLAQFIQLFMGVKENGGL